MKVHEVDVHPGAARAPRLARRDRAQRLVLVEPRGAGAVRPPRPGGAGRRLDRTRSRCCGACPRNASTPPRPTRASSRWSRASRAASTPTRTTRAGSPAPTPRRSDMRVAYFSLEFGLDAGIPLYSGGLGILAGDHLKSASDLGVPLVGGGPAVPRRLLPPVSSARTAASASATPPPTGRDLPLADQPGPDGRPVVGRGAGRRRPGPGGPAPHPGGPRAAAAARRRHRRQLPRGPRHHRRALRRRPRAAHPPGDPARRRRRPRARRGGDRADRLPHERGPLGAARPRADPRDDRRRAAWTPPEARERVLASTVFTTHTPVPAGNETLRPGRWRAATSSPWPRAPAWTWDELAALADRARRRRTPPSA